MSGSGARPPAPWLGELHRLDAALRAAGLAHSPDRWQNACDLLLRLREEGRLPQGPAPLRDRLAPLFCRTAEEQARFGELFATWWREAGGEGDEGCEASQPAAPAGEGRGRIPRVPFWPFLLLALTAAVGIGAWAYRQPPPAAPRTVTAPQPEPPSVPVPPGPAATPAELPPLQPFTPRTPHEPPALSAGRQELLAAIGAALPWLPPLLALAWLAWRHRRRRVVLQRRRDDPRAPLATLRLQGREDDDLFDGPEVRAALRRLHRPLYHPTRRLDEAATVDRSLRRANLFSPVYRSRARVPEVVVWVDLRHAHDPLAGLADTLVQRLREGGLIVHPLRSFGDPERLYDPERERGTSLGQAAARHRGARLLVVGEGELFLDAWSGEPLPWLEGLAAWPRRTLLTPGPEPRRRLRPLLESGLLLAPLTSAGLARLDDPDPGTGDRRRPLAPLLESGERWRSPVAPPAAALAELLRVLGAELGERGLTLLAAVAGYPQLHWGLIRLLDLGLFPDDGPAARERRLLRLTRLPWSRGGWLPGWLRLELLRRRPAAERRRIGALYGELFGRLAEQGEAAVELPLRLSGRLSGRSSGLLLDLAATSPADSPAHDHIFAGLLHGGLRSRLAFLLPRPAAEHLLRAGLAGGLRGVVTGLGVAGLLWFGVLGVWQAGGREAVREGLLAGQRLAFSGVAVQVTAEEGTAPLAGELAAVLQGDGFAEVVTAVAAGGDGEVEIPEARFPAAELRYPAGREEEAAFIAGRLGYLGFGMAVALTEAAGEAVVVRIGVRAAPGGGEGFRDRLAVPFDEGRWRKVVAGSAESVIDPEMVELPGGRFVMGCGKEESRCYNDEQPAHVVSIAPFAIGRYEVTFAEYDRFAEATGRKKPEDRGWGRGRRPVINVSWEDAVAYARWLSQQTDKRYRLPTEAEWEYAARAGTTTAFSTGGCITTDQANYNGNSDFNGCGAKTGVHRQQTLPVDELPPNPWGLQHIHGNVWEWTQDCWHKDYRQAPADGSAWEEEAGGDCSLRVVRGGGWNGQPVFLRSANRIWGAPGGAIGDLGFRLARTP